MEYNFKEIEKTAKEKWAKKDEKGNTVYSVEHTSAKPKFYILDMFPYPSGAGLHVGHPLGYIASDIYARYKRMKGFNVLHPMGFDAFGLPAEQYAIETGQHPVDTTKKNIARYHEQLDNIGFCYDWDREIWTSDKKYYKWTQWIFLQLFNTYFDRKLNRAVPIDELIATFKTEGNQQYPCPGDDAIHFDAVTWNAYSEKEQQDILMHYRLAFCGYGEVNWCEALGTVLANDEVVNGVSERGGHPVVKKKLRQWYLRITEYADRLLQGLETVDFSEAMKEMQRNWIGKSVGAQISFKIQDTFSNIAVFTTRPDTIFGVDFMVLAPEHDLVSAITTDAQKQEVEDYITYVKSRSERERMAEKKISGCFTGAYAVHPFSGKQIPVWISEYVLAGYGTGAIMAVPCGDERDHKFAQHFNIPITNIIGEQYKGEEAYSEKDFTLVNSDFINGLSPKEAANKVIERMLAEGIGEAKVNFKMRDAAFSRQRYWGEPFPIKWENGIAYPLSEEDLPLELPHVDKYGPGPDGEGPLANIEHWVNLTPSPSPEERGTSVVQEPGYINSTVDEWRRTIHFAKQNRNEPTIEEDKMWQALRNRNVEGCKFRRQHPIAGYIPDFVCLEKRLIVEIDGAYHNDAEQIKFDQARAQWLLEEGFTMIRFSNDDVNQQLNTVLDKIAKELASKSTDTNYTSENEQFSEEKLNNSGTPLPRRGAGGEVKRETNTMPGYAGSSWYFLRFMDPNNEHEFASRAATDYWNQVNIYIGGTEHAVGHLLYSRMWTKALYDLGYIGFDEPFKKLVNQGMITAFSYFSSQIKYKEIRSEEVIQTENGGVVITKVPKSLIVSYKTDNIDNSSFPVKITANGREFEIDEISVSPFRFKNIAEFLEGNCILFKENFHKWMERYPEYLFKIEYGIFEEPLWEVDANGREFIQLKAEVEKMSKSKYNVVNPDDIIAQYGADTFRMYEMFLGPLDVSKPWDTKGIEGVHRFLRKFWRLYHDDAKGWIVSDDAAIEAELKALHKSIKKIEQDTERFSFNTAVSQFMILVNELSDLNCHKRSILKPLVQLICPYAPHIAEELWAQLHSSLSSGEGKGEVSSVITAEFPQWEEKYVTENSKVYPVAINGKTRTELEFALDASQADIEQIVLANEVVQKWLEGNAPKKIIFVKGKMINIVL